MIRSLRTRLIVISLVLSIVPLIVVGTLITMRGSAALQDQAVAFQNELAQRTSDQISGFFNERQAELFALTNVYGLDTLDVAAQRSVLSTLLSAQPAYYQLATVAADGRVTQRITRGEVITTDDLGSRSDDPVFQAAVASRAVSYGGVTFNEVARDRLVTMAVPVEDLFTGQIGYVLMAEVRFQNISDSLLRDLNLGDDQDVFIVDGSGTIVAHRDPNRVIRSTVFVPPVEMGRATGLNGTDVILATHPVHLEGQELTVVAETSFARATVLSSDLSAIALIITLLSLAIVGVIVAIVATRVVKPIIEMSRTTAAIAEGDLSARVNESGNDEIAALGRSFNQMTTKLEQTLDGLRANEARLAATIEALPDMLFTIKADGTILDYRIQTADSAEPVQEMHGKHMSEVMPPDITRPIMRKVETALNTGTLQTHEYRMPLPQGALDFEARIVPANDDQLVVIARDITERKQAEAQREALIRDLQAAKRLAEENSRLKSEFLSMMSHELRTPLNAIEGFTGVVLKRIGGADFNAKTEEYLTRVHSNSRRLLQLINDFLDLSRVEAGRLELATLPFSPAKLAQRWKDEISVLAEKKGLAFDVSVDPALPETLYGDEEAISKVAINLLSNAIKFTETGGINLKIDRHDSMWNIVVSDTGIGIPPHAREFIFEEFRQVDQSSKRKYGGTGLGLAIVQKYTRSMGGNISVKSELGQGSTFTVAVPLRTTV